MLKKVTFFPKNFVSTLNNPILSGWPTKFSIEGQPPPKKGML